MIKKLLPSSLVFFSRTIDNHILETASRPVGNDGLVRLLYAPTTCLVTATNLLLYSTASEIASFSTARM